MSTLMSVDMNIERSSTRIYAPPGGKSSFSLSHDEPAAAAPRARAAAPAYSNSPFATENTRPAPAAGASSSYKTTAPYATGAAEQQQPVRRVRQAPGGTSSLVIG